MKRLTSYHWMAFAFLLVAIVRVVIYARRHAFIFMFLFVVPSVLAVTTSYVTIHNTGQGTIHQLTGITVYCDTSTGQSHANDAGYWNFYSPLTTGLGDYAWILASDEYDSITLSCNNYDSGSGNTENFTVVMGDGVGDTWTSSTSGMIHGGQNADLYIAIGPPAPAYTNYTFTINNSDPSRPAVGKWFWNGVLSKSATIAPGDSATFVSPDVEISPTNENFSESSTEQYLPSVTVTNGFDDNGNAVTGFSGNTPSGGATNTAAGSGSAFTSGTNTLTGSSGFNSDYAPTNLVYFPPSTGTTNGQGANNGDMEAGFQLLHADLKTAIAGQSVINDSINGGFGATTNLLGNIDLGMWAVKSNSDYIPHVYGAITNLHIGDTNPPATNVWVQNFPTNYQDVSADTSLAGISNVLAGSSNSATYNSLSNAMFGLIPATTTNGSAALAAADAAQGDYGVDGLLSQLTPTLPPESPSMPDMTMSFCGRTIDLNPVNMFPNVAAASYIGFKIVFLLLFLIDVAFMFWKVVAVRASTSTGGVPDLEVFGGGEIAGFGGELGGNYIGAIVALLIPLAFISIFSVAMSYLFSHLGIAISDAMNSAAFSTSLGSIGYYLLASFIPVNLLFSLICTRITLMFTLGKIVSLASAAARWLWGK